LNIRSSELTKNIEQLTEQKLREMDLINNLKLELDNLKESKKDDILKITAMRTEIQAMKTDIDVNRWSNNRLDDFTKDHLKERESVQKDLHKLLMDSQDLAKTTKKLMIHVMIIERKLMRLKKKKSMKKKLKVQNNL